MINGSMKGQFTQYHLCDHCIQILMLVLLAGHKNLYAILPAAKPYHRVLYSHVFKCY